MRIFYNFKFFYVSSGNIFRETFTFDSIRGQFYLGKLDELKYTESGKKEMAKGYIGNLCGWEILVSNNIAQPEDGVFYPLFGVKDKTLAGGISSDLNTTYYTPEKNFNTCYKGYGLYGVGAPRADMLGTVKVSAPLKVSA